MKNDSRFYQVYITTNEPIADSDDIEDVASDSDVFNELEGESFDITVYTGNTTESLCDVIEREFPDYQETIKAMENAKRFKFEAYKKVKAITGEDLIVHLGIPHCAKCTDFYGTTVNERKNRASEATVIAITDMEGNELDPRIVGESMHTINFFYAKGRQVYPEQPFSDDHVQCASGIHYFYSRRDAEVYR